MSRISLNAFVAVDVETANTNPSSICSIGIVDFHNGIVKSEYSTLVNPEDVFSAQHVGIHGIDEAAVRDAPTWGRMSSRICGLLSGRVIVSHTAFDRVALTQTSARWQVVLPTCTWLDSAVLARRAWPELARSGYGLHEVCEFLSYDLKHHDCIGGTPGRLARFLLAAMEALGHQHPSAIRCSYRGWETLGLQLLIVHPGASTDSQARRCFRRPLSW